MTVEGHYVGAYRPNGPIGTTRKMTNAPMITMMMRIASVRQPQPNGLPILNPPSLLLRDLRLRVPELLLLLPPPPKFMRLMIAPRIVSIHGDIVKPPIRILPS